MSDFSVQQQGKMLNNSKNDNSFASTPEYTQLVSEVENLRKLYQNLEKQISQGGKTGNIDLNENSSQFEHLTRSYKCLKYELKNLKSADVLNRLSSLENNVSQQASLWNDFSDYFQDFVTSLGKNDSSSNKICSQMKKPLININKSAENQLNTLNESDHELQSKKNQSNENQDNSIINELKYLKQKVQSLENKDISDRLSAVEDRLSTHNSLWDQFTSNIAKLYSSQKTPENERYKKELKGVHEQFSQLIQSIVQEENENLNANSSLEQRIETLERNDKIQTSLWNQFSSNISEIILLDSSSSTANNTKKQEKLREVGSQFKQLISEITHENEPISESSISSLKDEMKHIIQRVSSLENSNEDISSLEEQVKQHSILWAKFQDNIHHLLNNHNGGNYNDPNPEFAEDIRSLIQRDNGRVTTRDIQLEPSEFSNNGNDNDRLSRLENNVRVQQELWNLFMKNISAVTNNNENSNSNSDQFSKNRDAFISMVGELVRKNSNNNNSNTDNDQSYRISQLESQVRAQTHLWEQFVNNLQNSIGLNPSDKKAQSNLNEYHSQLEKLVNISDNSNINTRAIPRSVDNVESQKALDEIREQIKKLEEKQEDDLKRIQEQIKQENDSLKSRFNGLKSSVQDVEHKQSEAEKTTNEMIQSVQEQQQQQLKDIQKELNTAKKDIKTSQQNQKTQKGDIDAVKAELQKYQKQNQNQEQAHHKFEEEIQKLQTSQKQQQTNMDKHQQDYQKLQKDLQKVQKAQQTHEKSAKNYQTDLQKLQTAQQEQDNKLKNYQEEQRQLHEEEHKQQDEAHQKLEESLQKLESAQQAHEKSFKDLQNDLQKIQKAQQTQDKSTKNYKNDLQKLQTAQQEQDKAIKEYQDEQRQLHEDERKQQDEAHQKLEEALQKLQAAQQSHEKSSKNLQNDLQKIQKAQQTQDKSTKNYKNDLQKLQTAQQEQDKAIKEYQEEQRKLHDDERKQQDEAHQKLEEALQKLETAQQAHEKSSKNLQNDLQKIQKAQQTQDKSTKNYKNDLQKLQTTQQEQDKAIKNYQEELNKLQASQQEQENKLKNFLEEQNQQHEDDHKQQEEAHQKLEEALQKLQEARESQDQLIKSLQTDLRKLQKDQQSQDKTAKTSKTELQKLQTAQQEQDKAIKDYQEEQRKLHEDERKQQEEARLKIQEDIQKLKDAQDKSAKDYQTELQKLQRTQQTQDKSVKNSQAELQKLQKAQQSQQVPDGLFKSYQEEQRKLHEDERKQQEEAHQKIEDELKKLQTAQQTQDKSIKTIQTDLQKVKKSQKASDESLQNYQEEQRKLHEDEHKQQEETHQKHDKALQKLESTQQNQDKSIKTIQADLQKVQKAQQTQDKSTKNYKNDLQKLQTTQQEQDNKLKNYQTDLQNLQTAQQEQDNKLKNYQEEQRQLHEDEHKQQEEAHQKLEESLQKLESAQQSHEKSSKYLQNDLQKIQKAQQTQDKSTKNYKNDLQKLQTTQQEQDKAIKEYQEEQRQLHEDERKQQEEAHQKLEESLQKLESKQQTQDKSIKNIQNDIQKVQKAQQTQDKSVKNSQAELQKIQQAQQSQQVPDGLFKSYQEEQRKLHEEEHKQQEEAHQKIEDELKKLQTAQQTLDKSLKTYQNELQKVQKTQKKQDENTKNSQTELQKLKEQQQEQDRAIKDYQEEQRQIHDDESKQHEEEHQKIDEAISKLESAQQAQEETFKNHQNEFQKIQKSSEETPKSSQEDIQRIEEELIRHANILQDHDDIFTRYQDEHNKQEDEEHKRIEQELQKIQNNQNEHNKQEDEEHKKIEQELQKIQNNQNEQIEKVQKVENDVNVHSKLWEQFTKNLNGLLNTKSNNNDELNATIDEYHNQIKELATRNAEVQELGNEENISSLEQLRKDVNAHSSLWNQFVQNLLKLNIVDPDAENGSDDEKSQDFLKQSQKEFASQIRSLTSTNNNNNGNNNNEDLGQLRSQISEVSEKVDQHSQLWINYERNLQRLLNSPQSNSGDDQPSQFENDIKSLLATTRSVNLAPPEERNANQSYDSRLDKLESDVQAQKSLWEQFSQNIQILTNYDSEDENSVKALKQSRDAFAHQIGKIISHDNTDNATKPDLQEYEQRIKELEKNVELQNSLWTRFMNNIQGITAANESNSPESKELLKNCQQDFVDQMKSLVDHKVSSKDEPFFGSYERLAQEVSEIRKEINSLKSGNNYPAQERSIKLDDNESSLSENYAKNPAKYDMTNIRSAYDLPYSESHANDESSSSFEEAEYCQESSEYSSACPTSRSANNDNYDNENNEENNEDNNNNNQQHHHHHSSKRSSSPERGSNDTNNNEPTTSTTRDVQLTPGSHTTNIIHKVNNGPIQEQVDNIYKDIKCIKYELKQLKFRTDGSSPKQQQQQQSYIQKLRENQNQLSTIDPQSPEFLANNNENNLFNIEEPEESTESESEGGDYTNDELNKKIKLNKKAISRLQKKFDMIHSSMNKQVLLWDQFDNSLHQLLNATLAEMQMPTSSDIANLHSSIQCMKYEIRKMKVEEKARSEKLFEKKSVQEKQLQEEISQLVEEVRKLQKVCAKFNNIEEDSVNKNITDSIKCLKHEVRNLKKNSNFSSASTTEQSSIQKRRGVLSDENKKSTTSDNNSANKFASQASLDEWINEVRNLRNLYETIQYNSEIRPLSSAAETQSNTLLMSEEAASSSSFIDEKSEFSEFLQHKKNTDSRISKISDIPPQGHESFNANQPNDQVKEQIAALRSEMEILKRELKKIQTESLAVNAQNGKNTVNLLSTSSSSSQEHLEKLNNNDQSFEARIENIEKTISKIKNSMKNNTRPLSSSTSPAGVNDNINQDEPQSLSSLSHDVHCIKYELKKLKDELSKPSSLSQEAINSILTSKGPQSTTTSNEKENEGSRLIQYIFTQLEELPKLRNEIEILKKQGNVNSAPVNEREIIIDQNDDQKPATIKQLVSDVERLKTQLSSLNGRIDFISRGQPQKDDTLINGSISNISSLSLEDSFGDILLTSDQSQTRFEDINHEIENIHKELKNLTSQLSTIQEIVAQTIRTPEDGGSDTSNTELTQAQQQLLQQKQQRIEDIFDDLNDVKEEIKAIKANQLMFSDNSSITSMNSTSSIQSGTSKNDTVSILAKKYKKLQEQQFKLKEKVDQLTSASPSKLIDPSNPNKAAVSDDQNAEILELKELIKDLQLDQKRIKKLVAKYVQQGDKNQSKTGVNDAVAGETKDSGLVQNDDASQLDTLKKDLSKTKSVVSVLKREITQLSSSSKNNNDDIAYLKSEYERVRAQLIGFSSLSKAPAAAATSPKKTAATPATSKK